MYMIGDVRSRPTSTEGYSPGPFSNIKTNTATVAINEYAMEQLKRKIIKPTAGGNRKTRMKRQKRKRYTKRGNRK